MSDIQFGQSIWHQIYKDNGEFVVFQPPTKNPPVYLEQSDRTQVQQDPANNKNVIDDGDLPSGVNLGYITDSDFFPKRQDELMMVDGGVLVNDDIEPKFAPFLFERSSFAEPPSDFNLISNYRQDIRNVTHSDGTPANNTQSIDNERKEKNLQDLLTERNILQQRNQLLIDNKVAPDDRELQRNQDRIREIELRINPNMIVNEAIQLAELQQQQRHAQALAIEQKRNDDLILLREEQHSEQLEKQELLKEQLELLNEQFEEVSSKLGDDGSVSTPLIGASTPAVAITLAQAKVLAEDATKQSGTSIYEINNKPKQASAIRARNAAVLETLQEDIKNEDDAKNFVDALESQIREILDSEENLRELDIIDTSFLDTGIDEINSRINIDLDEDTINILNNDELKKLSAIYRLYGGYPDVETRALLKRKKPGLFQFKKTAKIDIKKDDDGNNVLVLTTASDELNKLTNFDIIELLTYIDNGGKFKPSSSYKTLIGNLKKVIAKTSVSKVDEYKKLLKKMEELE